MDADNIGKDDVLGSALTDMNGMFRIGFFNTDGINSGTVDLYFKIYARNGRINVCNSKGSDWYRNTSTDGNIPNGIINYGQLIFGEPSVYFTQRAAMVFLYMHWGWMFAAANGPNPEKFHAHYPNNSMDVSHSSDLLGHRHLCIRTEDAFAPDIVLHEYAHCIMYQAYADCWMFANRCPDTHHIYAAHNERCAWSEGWAQYFPLRVIVEDKDNIVHFDNRNGYKDYYYYDDPSHVDIAHPGFNTTEMARGQACEGRVAGLLHDLDDGVSVDRPLGDGDEISDEPPEGDEPCDCFECSPGVIYSCEDDATYETCCKCTDGDNISYGFSTIYQMLWLFKYDTLDDFFEKWKGFGFDTTFFLAAAHHNTIEWDLRPDLSPPNPEYILPLPFEIDTVPESLPDVYIEPCQPYTEYFNFSDYTWDPETWDTCDFRYRFINEQDTYSPYDGKVSFAIGDPNNPLDTCNSTLKANSECGALFTSPMNIPVYVCDRTKVEWSSFNAVLDGESELQEVRFCFDDWIYIWVNGDSLIYATQPPNESCLGVIVVPDTSEIDWYLSGQDNVLAIASYGNPEAKHLKAEFIYTITTSTKGQTRVITTNPPDWYSPLSSLGSIEWWKPNVPAFKDTNFWAPATGSRQCPPCVPIFLLEPEGWVWDDVLTSWTVQIRWEDCICSGTVFSQTSYKPYGIETPPATNVEVIINPSPIVSGNLNIYCSANGAFNMNIDVYDIKGRKVNTISLLEINQENNRIILPVNRLIKDGASGVYFVNINTQVSSDTHKLIIMK
jgi:hypothetical protein